MPDKRFRQFDVLNESRDHYSHEGDQLVVETSTGSMWGKGNTCKNLFLYPKPVSLFEAHVLTTILPQANGEQAGLVFLSGRR